MIRTPVRVDEVYLPLNGEGRFFLGKGSVTVQPMTQFRITEIRLSPLTKKYFRITSFLIGNRQYMIGDHRTYLHGSLFPMKVNPSETCGPSQLITFRVECMRKAAYFRGCLVGVAVIP